MGKGRKVAIIFGILFLIGGIILPLGQAALFSIPGYPINSLPSFVTNYIPASSFPAYSAYVTIGLGAVFLLGGAMKRGGGVKMPKEAAMPTSQPEVAPMSEEKMEMPKEEPMEQKDTGGEMEGMSSIKMEEPSMEESKPEEEEKPMMEEETPKEEEEQPAEEETSDFNSSETPQFMPEEDEPASHPRKSAKKKTHTAKAAKRRRR